MPEAPPDFIQQRLDALHDIDERIVAVVDSMGEVFDTYMEPSRSEQNLQPTRERFQEHVRATYRSLSALAIGLRREVKLMDENIGFYDRNSDHVMILPIAVEQRNTALGAAKLEAELAKLP